MLIRHVSRYALALALLSSTAGCVEESPDLSPAERQALAEFLPTEESQPQHRLDAHFENRVTLVGYDISTETVTLGQPFTVTWYWHVDRRLGEGWGQFTHLANGAGENRINQDSNGAIRERYPASRWREGDNVRDVQTITLPNDWNSDQLTVFLGFWHEEHRLRVTSGPNDGENRVRAFTVPVVPGATAAAAPAAPEAPIPTGLARHTTGAIQIDGTLDEADWTGATPTASFVNTLNGSAATPAATARFLWDDENVYVAFVVEDAFLKNTNRGRDAHLWEQDAVEVMLDPDGDGQNYFELQVAPTGDVFDTHYDTRRQPQPFGHVDWNADIEARVATRGTPNDDEADQGYTVEMRIARASLHQGEGPAAPATPGGAEWRVNLYVMDTPQEGGQHASGWSPTLEGDFHVPARFGRVRFAAPEVAAAPAPAAADTPENPLRQVPREIRMYQREVAAQGGRAIAAARGVPH